VSKFDFYILVLFKAFFLSIAGLRLKKITKNKIKRYYQNGQLFLSYSLKNIWDYTFEKWSENQADKYYARIKFACKEIGENPDLGKEYTKISRNLLGLKSGKHIIFYCLISENELEVIRILHERMDLEKRLTE